MNLKTLAKKAASLPNLDFDWKGIEQVHPEVFDREVIDLPSAIEYMRKLKERVAKQSFILKDLADAYMKLKDIILEAELNNSLYLREKEE